MALFSTSRLAGDNFLSGALISGIAAASLQYQALNNGKISKQTAIKNTIRLGLNGGILTGFGIAASNSIVKGQYLTAATQIGVCVALINITNQILKENDDKSIHKRRTKQHKHD